MCGPIQTAAAAKAVRTLRKSARRSIGNRARVQFSTFAHPRRSEDKIMPYRLDFTRRYARAFYRGDHKTITMASTVDGVAKDITEATFLGQVRANPGTPVLLTMSLSIISAVGGTWRLDWDDSDGEALLGATQTEPFIGWYDIQRTLGGVVTTLLYGQLEVLPDISRA